MTTPVTPTQDGFVAFLRAAGINVAGLPDNSTTIPAAFCEATETVSLSLMHAPGGTYARAVYNLATDIVFNDAQDVAPSTYFADARKTWNINGFVAGVVSNASDNGTGDGLLVPDSLSQLSLSDLQRLKTPWGRAYLAIAQKWGPDLFDII